MISFFPLFFFNYQVEYQDLEPVLSIEDALNTESFFPLKRQIKKGDVQQGFKGNRKYR